MTTKLTRRALLRRTAPAIIVGAATPLWAQWLAQEMRRLNRKWFQVPRVLSQDELFAQLWVDLEDSPEASQGILEAFNAKSMRMVQQIRQESLRHAEIAVAVAGR